MQRIKTLNGIRTMAFTMIFLSHCEIFPGGACGVSFFIILSGFLLVYNYDNKEVINTRETCNNRLFKGLMKFKEIYLLHILTMTPFLLFAIYNTFCLAEWGNFLVILINTFLNVGLLQSWIPKRQVFFSLNSVSWYLSTYIFLYMMYPTIIKIIHRYKTRLMIAVLFIIQLLIAVSVGLLPNLVMIPSDFVDWCTYISPIYRLLDFSIGCSAGYLFVHSSKVDIKKSFATVLEIISIIIIYIFILTQNLLPNFLSNSILFTIPVLICIRIFAAGKGMISRLFTLEIFDYLSKLSVPGFLIHYPVIQFILVILNKLELKIDKFILCLVSFVITMLLSKIYISIRKGKQINVYRN